MDLFDTELPQGWRWAPLRKAYRTTKRPRDLALRPDDKIVFAPMEAIPQAGNHAIRLNERRWSDVKSGVYFSTGDVLLSKITPSFENGKQGLAIDLPGSFGFASTEIIPLQPIDSRSSSWFLFYYLLHPEVRAHLTERMEGSTGRQRVPEDAVMDLPVPTPSPEVQTQIATILRTVQQAKAIEQRSVEVATALKHGTMRDLFTRGLRGEGQKETPHGPVPDHWAIRLLGYCATVQTGVTKGRKLDGDDLIDAPYLRVANVQSGFLDLSEIKHIKIRREELARYRLQSNDVVLTEGGDLDKLGRGFIWRGEINDCVHQNHIFAVRADRTVLDPEYLAYLVQSAYGRSYFLMVGHKTTNLASINSTKLKAFPVLIPPLQEQHEIARMLDAIDRKIDLHKRKRDVLDELFHSLLHKLMTGEIRVNDLSIPEITQ